MNKMSTVFHDLNYYAETFWIAVMAKIMKRKKNIVILSNSFPNPLQPHRGIYIQQIVDIIKREINPIIICPLPWFPKLNFFKKYKSWFLFANIQKEYDWQGYHVYSPKYIVVPKISNALSPLSVTMGLYRTLHVLKEKVGIDLINVHNAYPEGIAAVCHGKLLKLPVVVSARGSDINDVGTNGLRFWQIRWALRNAENLTAVSRPLCEKLIDMGADSKHVHYIPNGVDREKFHLQDKQTSRKKLGIPPAKKIVLFVGKLRMVKGLHHLVEGLGILKQQGKLDFETILIGSGYLENDLKKAISKRNLHGKVVFKGNLPHNSVSEWMAASDLFCLPSLNEGMPNVVLEALSCGLPVVATTVGGIPDLLNDYNGIMVPAANALSLARALKQGFERKWDPQRISNSISHFSWERSAKKYLDVIERSL